jgi:NAD(P)H-hydrate epimerase
MMDAGRMAAVDRNAVALGVSERQLMESGGNAVARVVREVTAPDGAVALVCGRGNNGGDAMVAARFLDRDVTVHLLGRPESIATDVARANWEALTASEVDARVVRDSRDLDLGDPDTVVDALLGTGVRGAPREPEASAIDAVNDADATVVSVDVPSGLDADTGESGGRPVEADRVVTFHDGKPGLRTVEAPVTVADIGIPDAAERFVGPGDLLALRRSPASHKGDHGEVLVVGGGPYTGAPALAARAAMRAGADLVRVACPAGIAREVQATESGLIVRPFDAERLTPDEVPALRDRAAAHDAVVLGPGLGDAEDTREAVRAFLGGYEGRAVVDADALREVPTVETEATLVCTPHAGEFREMGGGDPGTDRPDRVAAVEALAADLGATVLLKGRHDVVSDGERTRVVRTGTPAMTVGGTGDVLAGATGALLATSDPRLDPVGAAAVGGYANGIAGERAAAGREHGMLATDLLDELPAALGGEAGDRI